jgi:Ca-activated chloride channel family protein
MQEMARALRPMDKVTLITLAGEANIIFQPSWINSPDSLLRLINALQPAGGTNGAAAMRLAYTTALKEKLEGGNNQVIVATDGVFTAGTMGNEELLKLVNTYREKGIRLSTIGFGEAKQPIAFLSALAAAGGGDFLHVRDQATAESGLVEQLRRQSRK